MPPVSVVVLKTGIVVLKVGILILKTGIVVPKVGIIILRDGVVKGLYFMNPERRSLKPVLLTGPAVSDFANWGGIRIFISAASL